MPGNSTNELILSLGSNIVPRIDYLQLAIKSIENNVGNVVQLSKVYETSAWGFKSEAFLNICASVVTKKSTNKALKAFQEIENKLGRQKKATTNYEARVIDIDIIYSSEGVFKYSDLTVPHPLLHERLFVLLPLLEIAPQKIHPLLHVNTQQMVANCKDNSTVQILGELFT